MNAEEDEEEHANIELKFHYIPHLFLYIYSQISGSERKGNVGGNKWIFPLRKYFSRNVLVYIASLLNFYIRIYLRSFCVRAFILLSHFSDCCDD